MCNDFAVYAEWSDSMKKMLPEANTRVFNRVEVASGNHISLDMTTGVVTLQPGTYHITAWSIVAPFLPTDTDGRMTPTPRPLGGYCRLRYRDKAARTDAPIAIGTVSHAVMIPSMIDTFVRVDNRAEIVLDHQCGADVEADSLYLQVNVGDSSWHVFARIAVEKS